MSQREEKTTRTVESTKTFTTCELCKTEIEGGNDDWNREPWSYGID